MLSCLKRANHGPIGAALTALIGCIVIGSGTANAQQVLTVAVGAGTVPAGEYAGMSIRALVVGSYSGMGLTTLIEGRAVVTIGARRFDSVVSPALPSLCCGEGHVGADFFSMTGHVRENAVGAPHTHLFGTSASTDGTMCVNIVDQTNSVVPPAEPPHDPGVGLICGMRALVFIVPLRTPLVALNTGGLSADVESRAAASPAVPFEGDVPQSSRARAFAPDRLKVAFTA